MKRRIFACALSGLFLMGTALLLYINANHSSSVLLNKVLSSHNVPHTPNALTDFVAEARWLSYYQVPPGAKSSGIIARNVTVWNSGNRLTRNVVHPTESREQREFFDGERVYRSEFQNGKLAGPPGQIEEWEYKGINFSFKTFGLIPLLAQLQQDATVQAVHLAGAGEDHDTLVIRTALGTWTLYLNREHLISRAEITRNQRVLKIEYLDYRRVGGVQVPFVQRLSANGALVYELFFTRIDLSPSFPEGCFDREALSKASVGPKGVGG